MTPRIFTLSLAIAFSAFTSVVRSQESVTKEKETVYRTETDIPYRSGPDRTEYMKERCRLDVYAPASKKGFSTVVWFQIGRAHV